VAETRTHDPKDKDELDRALREALGDPIRPIPAGSSHQPQIGSLPHQSMLGRFASPAKPASDSDA